MYVRTHRSFCGAWLALLCAYSVHGCGHSDSTSREQEAPDSSSSMQDTSSSPVPDSNPLPEPTSWPPDPSKVAPAINRTVATDIARATEFIYSGTNPIQVGVAAGTIERKRVAVLRGKVRGREGNALAGVKVTILSHPEYGYTETRADGEFDLVVNGGGPVTITYTKNGCLTAQRQVQTPWRDYVVAPEVVMVAYDSNVTEVKLDAMTTIETARGSTVEDSDGKRQAMWMVHYL